MAFRAVMITYPRCACAVADFQFVARSAFAFAFRTVMIAYPRCAVAVAVFQLIARSAFAFAFRAVMIAYPGSACAVAAAVSVTYTVAFAFRTIDPAYAFAVIERYSRMREVYIITTGDTVIVAE